MPGAPDLRTTDTAVSYVSRDGQLRTVDIRVWYRAGGATVASPLIVVSHGGVGAMGAQDRFGHLAELYTAAGFVTAVLNHPPSTNAEPGHRFDRPDDVTAVLDHLTHFSMPGDFNGVIDTANTGHVGHSYGAYTAHAVGGAAFDQGNFRDPRVQAIVPLSAQGDARFGSFDVEPDIRLPSPDSSWAAVTIPTYNILGEYEADNSVSQIFQSDDWRCLPYARYANRQDAFLSVVPAGLHSDFGDQGEEAVKAFVARNTLLFFDRYLRGRDVDPCSIGNLAPRPGTRTFRDSAWDCASRYTPRSWFSQLRFTRDWSPGSVDAGGQTQGGTELMALESFQGMLFAATGYWRDDGSGNPDEGPMVLRKESAGGPWLTDRVWPLDPYVRVDAMQAIDFTILVPGSLPQVQERLVVAVSHPSVLSIWTRGESGAYVQSIIDTTLIGGSGGRSVRSMALHFDPLTGVEHLFVGTNRGEIYRGTIDLSAAGFFTWQSEPIDGRLVPGSRRVMALTDADGIAYATLGPTETESGGLYRRIDGASPSWELVAPLDAGGSRPNLRGLTAFSERQAPFVDRLIGVSEADGLVRTYDPFQGLQQAIELDVAAFLAAGQPGQPLLIDGLAAYNRFRPAIDPRTGEQVLLFGLLAGRSDGSSSTVQSLLTTPPDNGTYLLVRRANGSYEQSYLLDVDHPPPAGEALRGIRAIAVSPFPEDRGAVLYVGGYDAGDADPRLRHGTAWLYRGAPPVP